MEDEGFKTPLYYQHIVELSKQFERINFSHMPQDKNQFADALATLASIVGILVENLIEPLEIEISEHPAYCCVIEEANGEPWYANIKKYLKLGEFPKGATHYDRKVIRRLVCRYFLSGENPL